MSAPKYVEGDLEVRLQAQLKVRLYFNANAVRV
jgi:hypothetical protein